MVSTILVHVESPQVTNVQSLCWFWQLIIAEEVRMEAEDKFSAFTEFRTRERGHRPMEMLEVKQEDVGKEQNLVGHVGFMKLKRGEKFPTES